MDIRIVNTCNNDCLYCLEGSLRNKIKYINKDLIISQIKHYKPQHLNFYGGNPLLHPNLLEIIKYASEIGIKNISLLTNSYGVNLKYLLKLRKSGLSSIGVYFNCFSKENHYIINGGKNNLSELLTNLKIYRKIFSNIKLVIHVNKMNIMTLGSDIKILHNNFGINNFDFVNYFPFDKPYKNKSLLAYNICDYRHAIDNLLNDINILGLKVNFFKFSRDFFGNYGEYYNYKKGVLEQIGEEDISILNADKIPFCYNDKRCEFCFLKDNCKFYEG